MFRSFAQRASAAARVALPAASAALVAGSQFAGASGEDHIEPPKYQWDNGPFSTFDAKALVDLMLSAPLRSLSYLSFFLHDAAFDAGTLCTRRSALHATA